MKQSLTSISSALSSLLLSALLPQWASSAEAITQDFGHQLKIQSNFDLAEGSTLENFPVLVRLSESIDGFSYADFKQLGGADLRFLDETGHTLSHEIQQWNPEGESLVWVRLPTLSSSTFFFMFYGTTETVSNNPADTWSMYDGVWHFDENESGGTSVDSTANHYDGDNATGIQPTEGVLGLAREMASGGISLPSTRDVNIGRGYTFSGWVYHNGGASWDHLIYRKNGSTEETGFAVEFNSANDNSLDTLDVFSSWSHKSQLSTGLTAQNWHYVTLIQYRSDANDGVESWLFNNGVQQAYNKVWWTEITHRALPIVFGTDCNRTGNRWHGRFDEFRLRFSRASADWAAAEYASMADPEVLTYSVSTPGEKLLFADHPTISWEGGDAFAVNADLMSGTGDILYYLPDLGLTNFLASASFTDGPQSALLSGLAANTCYQFGTFATNALGDATELIGTDSATFLTGEVSIQPLENGLVAPSRDALFVVERPRNAEATRYDLTVHYSLSGTATSGTDFAPVSGSVVIRAGFYSEHVRIPVLPEAANGAFITLTLEPGPYKTTAANSATVRLYQSEAARDDVTAEDFACQVLLQSQVDLGGESISDFPLLVRLGSHIEGFSYSDFQQPGGADLAFFDGTGRILPYEIQTWNPAGESLVWVRMPTFDSQTTLTLCYGLDRAVENHPAEVWDGFTGVWHFEGADADRFTPDASGNLLDAHSGAHIGDTAGIVGNARALDTAGTSGDFGILLPQSSSLVMGQHFTLSGWVLRHPGTPSWDHLFYRKSASNNGTGWATEIRGDQIGKMRVYAANDGNREIETGLKSDTWAYLTFVFDTNRLRLYNNGELMVDTSLPGALNESVRPISFGTDSERDDNPWYGRFDEFRLRLDAASAARAKADYEVMSNPAALSYSAVMTDLPPMVNLPPILTRVGEKAYVVSATLNGGKGDMFALCNDSITSPISHGIVTGPYTAEAPLVGLQDDTCYKVALVVTNTAGVRVVLENPNAFLYGNLSVTMENPASARHGLNGLFTIRRPDTEAACLHDLAVAYTLSGTAIAGTDFADTLSGSVVIPAGEASVDLPVNILPTATEGVTLTLSLAPGLYELGDNASATMEFSDESLLPNFANRIEFTVQGITNEGTILRNFPVLVRLDPALCAGFRYSSFRGGDTSGLIFTDENDRVIPYEVDTWNPNGQSLVWVKVPTVMIGTKFYAYYGADPAAITRLTEAFTATDTWSDYIGVWHLNETGDANAPVYDATANDLDGTAGPLSLATEDGVLGRARIISTEAGEANQKGNITIPYKPAMDLGGYYTASWWVKANNFSWTYFIGRKWNDNSKAWALQLTDTRAKLRIWVSDWLREYDLGTTLQNNQWYKMTVCVHRPDWGRVYYYLNGQLVGDYEMGNDPDNGTDSLYIGGPGSAWGTLHGKMDEVRLRASDVGSAWVQAEYLQETDPTFLQYSPVQPLHPATILFFR